MRVDAHHHLWQYRAHEFEWIDDSMEVLRRDFSVTEFERVAGSAGIDASVAVQARQTIEETRWLLALATRSPVIGGVVGWLPLAAPDFSAVLEEFAGNELLKGLRHVLQGEPDGFMEGRGFQDGIATLRGTGLVYDVLITERQLPEAIRLIDQHPEQLFVVDHGAKPAIRSGGLARWTLGMRELARREHVTVKLSGLVTEADWQSWTPETLLPYFETMLDAFTPARLMFGSDWPVLTVATSYGRWMEVVGDWIGRLASSERELIEGGVAEQVYRLGTGTAPEKQGRSVTP